MTTNGTETDQPAVSVLGLGLMGSAIAKAFLAKGHKVSVWNRSANKAQALVKLGALESSSAADCVRASDLIITVFTGYQAFCAVMGAIDVSVCQGRNVIDFGTGSPSQVRESTVVAQQRGFKAYIHGAMLAYPSHVGHTETVALYSGPSTAFTAAETALTALGKPVYLDDEDPTRAAVEEVIIDTTFYTMCAGFIQSIALMKRAGFWSPGAAEKLTRDVITPVLSMSHDTLLAIARQIDKGDYQAGEDGCRLENHVASVRNFMRTFGEMKTSTLGLEALVEAMDKRIAEGGSEEELSGLVEVL